MKYSIFLSIILFASTLATKANAGTTDEGAVMKITKAEFLKQIMDYETNPKVWKYAGTLPCVVDFYADWCAPCRLASPVLEELAKKYKGQIVVYKVNTDQEKELAGAFGISGIPSFLWVPKTCTPTMKSGVPNNPAAIKEQFEKMINEFLLKK
jgi:thioredoxin 1